MKNFCLKCHCGREGKFCRYCGMELVELPSRCECGRPINIFDFYCVDCGREIPNGWFGAEQNRPDLKMIESKTYLNYPPESNYPGLPKES